MKRTFDDIDGCGLCHVTNFGYTPTYIEYCGLPLCERCFKDKKCARMDNQLTYTELFEKLRVANSKDLPKVRDVFQGKSLEALVEIHSINCEISKLEDGIKRHQTAVSRSIK